MAKIPIIKLDPVKFELKELQLAVKILREGGVIAYPTETVYGLGANIFSRVAVERIFQIKGRDAHKPLSVMISSLDEADELCEAIPDSGRALMAAFWPGPLTLILNASESVPAYIKSKDDTIGVRFPDHPVCIGLVQLLGEPITSTSANLAGENPPVQAEEVKANLGDQIDFLIDGGECVVQIPSTVVDITAEEPRLLRAGAIPFQKLKKVYDGAV